MSQSRPPAIGGPRPQPRQRPGQPGQRPAQQPGQRPTQQPGQRPTQQQPRPAQAPPRPAQAQPRPAASAPARRPAATPQRASRSATLAPTAPRPSAEDVAARRSQERFAERRRAERRRRAGSAARWWLAAIALVAAAWAVWFSPLFALDTAKIEVRGATGAVSDVAVREALVDLSGVPLPRILMGDAGARVEAVHGVDSVQVSRAWPDGLLVEVAATKPVAAVPGDDGFLLIDRRGAAIATAAAAPDGVPVVTVPVGTDHARVLRAVLDVLAALPPAIADRVDAASAATEDTVVLELIDGPRIEWGSAEESALKVAVVAVMLDDPKAASAGVIDVSSPTLPVTRAE